MSELQPVTFSNQPVPASQLPSVAGLVLEAISPRYRWVNIVLEAGLYGMLMAAASVIRFQPWWRLPDSFYWAYPYLLALLAVMGLVMCGYHYLADTRIQFALREQDLVLKKGLLFRKTVCQPILRIQHIELKQGPADRLAKLTRLQVFSAGGAGHTFEIPGLPTEQARRIRQFVLEHKDLGAK